MNVRFTFWDMFQVEIESYYGKCFCTDFDQVTKIQTNKSVNNRLPEHLLFIDYGKNLGK